MVSLSQHRKQSRIILPRRENVIVTPNVEILVRDGDGGRILRRVRSKNLVTSEGLYKLIRLIAYPDEDFPSWSKSLQYIAVGTGITAPVAGDTVMEAEVLRKSITRRYPQTLGIDFYLDVMTSEGNGSELSEIGLFSESTGGTLWARCVHSAITKTALISVQYRWNWTFGAT